MDHQIIDDAALIVLARGGDAQALETLLTRHHAKVLGLCRRMMGDDADAQDVSQEALVAVCRGLSAFDGRAAFTTWLYRITTNACLDELRRRRRRPETVPDDGVGELSTGYDHAGAVGVRLDVDHALRQLPEDFRVAVVLRDICDLDYDEIARLTGAPPGTVRSRIARGRAALARHLAPADGNPAVAPDVGTTDHG